MGRGYTVMRDANEMTYLTATADSSGTLVLEPDSITRISNNSSINTANSSNTFSIRVGTWDEVNHTVTSVSGATATVVINGNTINVSGSGTYILADGTTDMTE